MLNDFEATARKSISYQLIFPIPEPYPEVSLCLTAALNCYLHQNWSTTDWLLHQSHLFLLSEP